MADGFFDKVYNPDVLSCPDAHPLVPSQCGKLLCHV